MKPDNRNKEKTTKPMQPGQTQPGQAQPDKTTQNPFQQPGQTTKRQRTVK